MNTQAVGLRAYVPIQTGATPSDAPRLSQETVGAMKPGEAQASSNGQGPARPGTSADLDPRGRHLDILA